MDKKTARSLLYQDHCYTTEQYEDLFNKEVTDTRPRIIKVLIRGIKRTVLKAMGYYA